MVLEATIANHDGAGNFNTREIIYTDYMQVRVIEGNTSRILFYGRIERVQPDYDSTYGQTVTIYARDNLQELLKRTLDTTLDSDTERSARIAKIVSQNIFDSDSIDTSDTVKFTTSFTEPVANALDQDFTGSGKTAIRAMAELANADKSNEDSGWVYYLDSAFSGTTAAPDLHYFVRGAVPSGGPLSHGLQIQFQGADGDQIRSILPDYKFPKIARELITRVKVIYTDPNGANQELVAILVNHDTPTGAFVDGAAITWAGGGAGRVEFSENSFTIIGPTDGIVSPLDTNFLKSVSNKLLTSGGNTATTNTTTETPPTPPGSLREAINQDIEKIERYYGETTEASARTYAKELLYTGANTIQRGNFKILRWPYARHTGTHSGAGSNTVLNDGSGAFTSKGIYIGDTVVNTTDSNTGIITAVTATQITTATPAMSWDSGNEYRIDTFVRTGHAVRLRDISGVTDQNALVTKIIYNEGPGVQHSDVEVLFHSGGRGLPLPSDVFKGLHDRVENTEWQTSAATGGLAFSAYVTNLSNVFTVTDWDTITWGSGTATFSDGTTQTVDAGNRTFAADAVEYFYLIKGNTTLQTSATFSNTIGLSKNLVAIGGRNRDGSEAFREAYIVSLNPGSSVLVANTIVASDISAISANLGTITSGTIRIPSGSTVNTDTTGFTGFMLTGDQIAGFNDGTPQAYLKSSDGKFYAGAGSIVLDAVGAQIIGITGAGLTFRPEQDGDPGGFISLGLTTGTHEMHDNSATLIDTGGNFIERGVSIGDFLNNITDGSSTIVTNVTTTHLTGTLAGGTDNDWDIDDTYEIRRFIVQSQSGRTLKLQGHTANIDLTPQYRSAATGVVTVGGNLAIGSRTGGPEYELRFYEDTANGYNYVGFKAAATLAGDQIWELPAVDGASSTFLQTDGAGTLTWAAGGGVTDHGALTGLGDADHAAYSLTSHAHSGVYAPNAFSTINISADGGTQTGAGIGADSSADSCTLIAGSNITLHGDVGADSIKISSSGGSGTVSSGSQWKGVYYSGTTTVSPTTFYAATSTWGSTSSRIFSMATTQFYASGDVELSGLSTDSGTYLKLNGSNDVVLSSSSRKYKENIENLTLDTSPVYDLAPRSFKYKNYTRTIHSEEDDPEPEETLTVIGKNSFGFIAEEVNELLPDLVLKNNDGEPEDVEYQLVSILLLEEMKKLKTRIEVLEGN